MGDRMLEEQDSKAGQNREEHTGAAQSSFMSENRIELWIGEKKTRTLKEDAAWLKLPCPDALWWEQVFFPLVNFHLLFWGKFSH